MQATANKQLVIRLIEEVQNSKNIDLCDQLFSVNFINHTPPRKIPNTREGMRLIFSMTHTAFPDGKLTIQDQIADEFKVWTRKTFLGTFTAPFGTVPPNGNKVEYEVIDILKIADGRFVEHWNIINQLPLLKQLGVPT